MKKLAKSKERTLVKTTMVAMFITAILLISSVNAAPLVTQPSNEMSTQELNEQPSNEKSTQESNELQAHENNIPIPGIIMASEDNLQNPALVYRTDDVGVVSIDAPVSGLATGAITPKATVKNYGSNNLTDVPVLFQIGYTVAGPGSYFYNFESNDGGWIKSASWSPYIGDWEWTNTYNVANYVYGGYPTSEKPPLTAYSGTGLWGTKMYTPYTNAGGFSRLSKIHNFSSLTNPTISWRSWEQVFGSFDYCQLRVNGNLVWGPSWDYAAPLWRLREVDLSAYSGLPSVNITFEMYATTVVNYAGWYIDDVLIGEKVLVPDDYNYTELVNLNAGESVQVEFPTWIPDEWQNQENVTIPYDVWVRTNLSTDPNPDNDLLMAVISLHYGFSHDIAMTDIVQPVSGTAGVITPEVVVTNVGQSNETNVPVRLVISKPYFAEHFDSTTFPPTGWTQEQTDEWRRVTTANAGGKSPEARLYYSYIVGNYAYLQSPAVDTSGDTEMIFEFRSMVDSNYGGSNCKVLIRGNALANWTDITPWSNPINADILKAKYIVNASAYVGNATQVRFEFSGTSAGISYWYLDNITIYQLSTTEYDHTMNVNINAGDTLNIIYPDWTPSDLGTAENLDILYTVLADSQLGTDNNTVNNVLAKDITLHYSWIHDVAVTQIIEPQNGLAQVQPVKVTVANNGQNDETVNVDVVIEKFNGTSEGFEGSDGGYVQGGTPAGTWAWGTPTSGPMSAHTGSKLWATNLAGNYPACNVTLDKAVTLSSGSVSLTFWHWYDTEASYDGGNVKISTDNGTTFTLITPVGGYTGTANSANPLGLGSPIFSGHGQKYWEKEEFDLSAYAGQSVIVRWHFGADSSVFYPGWYIDDVCFADPTAFLPEYDETVSVDIAAGETMNVTFPDWTPSDITLAFGIDYRATATATLIGSTNVITEDFSSYSPGNWGPLGWGTDKPSNWMISYTTNAGGTSPEAMFSWTPSAVAEFHLYTGPIDTSAYTALILEFKEKISGYYGPFTLKVDTSTDNITWNTAYSFSPTASIGPRTTTIPLTAADGIGSATFRFRFTFSGDSYNIDYWYIDDIKFSNLVVLPDGNPGNNVLAKWFTLSYEHDVGISVIAEPIGPHTTQSLIWTTGTTTNAMSDGGYLFEAAIRFNVTDMSAYNNWDISTVQFFKGYGTTAVPACSGNIKVYSSTDPIQPETLITTQPWSAGVGSMWVNVTLNSPVKILPGLDYWVSVEYTAGYTSYPAGCDGGPAVDFKGDWLWDEVTPWTEMQIWGFNYNWNIKAVLISPVPAEWPPGTYPIAAIADNYGVTFTENNFVVNAKVFKTSKADVLVYEENVTVTGALAPGQNVLKNFPDITIDNVTASEGNYRIEIKTMLPGDDHPTNDKKTKTFTIFIPDFLPPVTTHAFAGTMGNDGWYRSNVTITLTASDPTPPYRAGKGPSGVNHTYYKIDDSEDFVEYTAPVVVNTDGQHQVSYYSVDKVGNTEAVKGPFSFKLDKTAPTITITCTAQNLLKNKWLIEATVSDETSGIVLVEFYVADALVANITEAPWEYLYIGTDSPAQCIVYDGAGNSAVSNSAVVLSYEVNSQPQSYLNTQSLKLQNL